MDLTHGSVLRNDEELLTDVPMYISSASSDDVTADRKFASWGGCLHLTKNRDLGLSDVEAVHSEYSIKLRDGRLGNIRIRKVVCTNGANHVEILFEGASPLREKA